jgi:hypothetical protein
MSSRPRLSSRIMLHKIVRTSSPRARSSGPKAEADLYVVTSPLHARTFAQVDRLRIRPYQPHRPAWLSRSSKRCVSTLRLDGGTALTACRHHFKWPLIDHDRAGWFEDVLASAPNVGAETLHGVLQICYFTHAEFIARSRRACARANDGKPAGRLPQTSARVVGAFAVGPVLVPGAAWPPNSHTAHAATILVNLRRRRRRRRTCRFTATPAAAVTAATLRPLSPCPPLSDCRKHHPP